MLSEFEQRNFVELFGDNNMFGSLYNNNIKITQNEHEILMFL